MDRDSLDMSTLFRKTIEMEITQYAETTPATCLTRVEEMEGAMEKKERRGVEGTLKEINS